MARLHPSLRIKQRETNDEDEVSEEELIKTKKARPGRDVEHDSKPLGKVTPGRDAPPSPSSIDGPHIAMEKKKKPVKKSPPKHSLQKKAPGEPRKRKPEATKETSNKKPKGQEDPKLSLASLFSPDEDEEDDPFGLRKVYDSNKIFVLQLIPVFCGNAVRTEQMQIIVDVGQYKIEIMELRETPENEPISESPIWGLGMGPRGELWKLQQFCLQLSAILAATSHCDLKSDDMSLLSVYLTYQIEQNRKDTIDAPKDMEMMDTLIKRHYRDTKSVSISDTFGVAIRIESPLLRNGWKTLDAMNVNSTKGKNAEPSTEMKPSDKRAGAQLLLLLAYIMVSKVTDKERNEEQIIPALEHLASKPAWRPVLRQLVAMLVAVSPDPNDSAYDECHKLCTNPDHFLQNYLSANNAEGKAPSKTKIIPKVDTARALQRLSILFMCGYLYNLVDLAEANCSFKEGTLFKALMKLYGIGTTGNILRDFGYDIALRNWIKSATGTLQLAHVRKPRVSKKVDQELHMKLKELEDEIEKKDNKQGFLWDKIIEEMAEYEERVFAIESSNSDLRERVKVLEGKTTLSSKKDTDKLNAFHEELQVYADKSTEALRFRVVELENQMMALSQPKVPV